MSAIATLNTIAIDVVGHYGQTAKNLFAAYRAGTERAVNAFRDRYEQLVERQPLPWINSEIKASLVASQQRVARRVVDSTTRFTKIANSAVDRISAGTVKGIEAFGEQTAWANDMFVVGAFRKINLPAAKLSLQIAGRVDEASRRLSRRMAVTAVAKPTRRAKRSITRARGATRAV
ncbi:MAG TPA: hypothetical protein VMG60_14850 [Burkholderiaceae bacterium]|nr:hypothetical protein [Burkholderiaceae bacterium]